jgi:twinkle protein
MTDAKMISKGACEKCGSVDNKVLYDDGHSFCFGGDCQTYFPPDMRMGDAHNITALAGQYVQTHPEKDWKKGPLSDRRISEATAVKFGVRVNTAGVDVLHHEYPYYKGSEKIATKVRDVKGKEFYSTGQMNNAQMFGTNVFPAGGKYITVTEGECDAMAAYELMGSKYPAISIKSSSSAMKDFKANFEYIDSFEFVVLSFDMDEAGDAAKKVAALFEPKKVRVMKMDYKDANDYLRDGKFEAFMRAWWGAEVYTPAGIINLGDVGDDLYDDGDAETCLYPWVGLNDKLYGIRTGELVTLTAGTGTGKSSILRELMYHILQNTKDNIGVIALEENVKQTCFHLMSVPASDRLYLRERRSEYTREQLKVFEAQTLGTGRFYAFDHFGSLENDEILNRVRYMVKALDCKWIFLDHLSILVSGQEGTDERRSIDILMTKLRSIVEETNCSLMLVSHLRRTSSDKGAEDGKEISLGHLRGSQSIAQLSDIVIALERDQQADDDVDANTTVCRVLKNRYAGENGIATHLYFHKETGRLEEVEGPSVRQDNFDTYPPAQAFGEV